MGIYGIYTSRQQMAPALPALLDFLLAWFETDQAWCVASSMQVDAH